MLDPSSSEESEAELPPEDETVVKTLCEKLPEKKPKSEKNEKSSGAVRTHQTKKAVPPPEDQQKKDEQETLQREEAERKTKLQIYVFVLRCIAYPFNAKQPTDMARRQQKVSECPCSTSENKHLLLSAHFLISTTPVQNNNTTNCRGLAQLTPSLHTAQVYT